MPKIEGAWITGVNAATLAVARVARVTERGRAAAVGSVSAGSPGDSVARTARALLRPGASTVAASTVEAPALAGARRLAPEGP
ncbi:hypothetical protein WME91_31990 [Sorangium sp. So ce269]